MDPVNGDGVDAAGGRYRGTDPRFGSVPVVGTENREGFYTFYNKGTEVPTKIEKGIGREAIAPLVDAAPAQSNVIALGSTVGLTADVRALAIGTTEGNISVID